MLYRTLIKSKTIESFLHKHVAQKNQLYITFSNGVQLLVLGSITKLCSAALLSTTCATAAAA